MVQSMSHYALSRSVGQTKTVDFFQVNANQVKVKDLKSEAVDVTAVTEVFVADKQGEQMADFCARKLKKFKLDFVLGAAYYKLIRKELVQEGKEIMLRDKRSGKFYAGPKVRDMIGIPLGTRGYVSAGNLGDWDVFIRSTAPNRKPPVGVEVAYRRDITIPCSPTWKAKTAAVTP